MAFLGGPLLTGKRSLGANLGADLGSALQGLAQHKTQQMASNEKAKFWTSQGVDAQTAKALSQQPEAIQKSFFDRWEAPQQQQQMAQAPQQPTQPSYSPEEVKLLKSIANPDQRNKVAQMMQQQRQSSQPVDSSEPSRQFGQAAAQQQVAEKFSEANQGGLRSPGKLSQQQELAAYKDELKEKQELRKIDYADVKESKKWIREKNKKAKGIKENNLRLDRMRKLVENGKLTSPELAAGLDTLAHGVWGVGINLKGFQNADSQEFEKLSSDMFKGIQDIFGSRILKTEVDNFAKTIPTLLQSDAGKIAVIDNLKMLSEASLAEDKVAKEIVRANGGQVPPNLEDLVEQQLGDYLDDLHDRFVNQTHEVPKTEAKRSLKNAFIKKAFKGGLTGSLL